MGFIEGSDIETSRNGDERNLLYKTTRFFSKTLPLVIHHKCFRKLTRSAIIFELRHELLGRHPADFQSQLMLALGSAF